MILVTPKKKLGSENDDILNIIQKKKPKKKVGRKSRWNDYLFGDAVDVTVNNEYHRKKLIFQNKKTNAMVKYMPK